MNQKKIVKKLVIDATNLILGRMSSHVAKLLRQGIEVSIINCEKVIVSGGRMQVLKRAFDKRNHGGPLIGPFVPRMPDRYVKRSIRGMVAYKKPYGKKAFNRLRCYVGLPPELEKENLETIDCAKGAKLTRVKYVTIREICKHLGGKI